MFRGKELCVTRLSAATRHCLGIKDEKYKKNKVTMVKNDVAGNPFVCALRLYRKWEKKRLAKQHSRNRLNFDQDSYDFKATNSAIPREIRKTC